MNKKGKFIIFNDVHLKTGNEIEVCDSIMHMLEFAKDNDITNVVCAGDFFDSRSFQRQLVLMTAADIFDKFEEYGVKLLIIPGNHDKAKYDEENSFVGAFRSHPAIEYFESTKVVEIEGHSVCLIPFFREDILIKEIEQAPATDIMIGHFEMYGTSYHDVVCKTSSIKPALLKKFNKVYLGHIHDLNKINDWICHLPSFRQNNFGENSNKGFTVIDEEGCFNVIKGVFREHKKVSINIDRVTSKELKALIEEHKDSEDIVRFSFTGSDVRLKALDKKPIQNAGINVEIKSNLDSLFDVSKVEMPKAEEFKHTKGSITALFKVFCEDNKLNVEEGLTFLKNHMDG